MTQQPSRAGTFGAILRVTSGNFLEQFDFFLFGFYATYIAKTFFPAESEFAGLMLTFAVFGSGFLMRPIGAVVLGAYIDRIGRRKGLMVTLAIMGCGTLLIALVPGYQTIGLLAPCWSWWDVCYRDFLPASNWVASLFIFLRSPRQAIKAFTPVGNRPASRWRSWSPR